MSKINDLRPQTRNANQHTPNGMGALRTSIGKWGIADGITVAADGESISGSARLETLAEIMPDVKVVVVDTEGDTLIVNRRMDIPNANTKEAQALSAAVNIVQRIDYAPDGEILALIAADDDAVMRLIRQDDVSEEAVKQALADGFMGDAEPQIDRAAELNEKWQVKPGDLWRIGEHRLLCGDSTKREDVERVVGEREIDLVLTDPPYSVDYAEKNRALQTIGPSNRLTIDIEGDTLSTEETADRIWSPAFENAFDVSRSGAVIYCFSPQGGDQMMMMMMMMMKAKWNERLHQLIWRKNSPTFSMGRLDYQYQHEPVLYTWKGTNHGYYSEVGRSIIDCDRPSASKLHPTMKPVELFEIFIRNSSRVSEFVYEPFAGSGTNLVACQNLRRKCRAIEISPNYCAVILERMATAFPGIDIERLESITNGTS